MAQQGTSQATSHEICKRCKHEQVMQKNSMLQELVFTRCRKILEALAIDGEVYTAVDTDHFAPT
jgi:methylphosphotriester-DNA--protein-cysteine methyltransferase